MSPARILAWAVVFTLVVLVAAAYAQVRFSGGRSSSEAIVFGSATNPTRLRSSLTDPANPVDGDTWVACARVLGELVCSHKVRIGGTTYVIASVTVP